MADEVEKSDEIAAHSAMRASAADESRAMERVSDADRERAGELIQEALSDGRLALDEIDDRLGAVMAARTRGDLEAALIHLPGAEAVLGTTGSNTPDQASGREGAPVLQAYSAPVHRTGAWTLPGQLTIRGRTSSVHLDLTEAELPVGNCHIELDLRHCSLRIVVPDDVRVEADEVAPTGSPVNVRAPKNASAGPPRLVIHLRGTAHMSSVYASGPGRLRRRALRKAGRSPS